MRKIQNAELNRLSVDDFKLSAKKPFIIVLDNVRSMNNVGSIFRTADAFRCSEIILCGITPLPPHREIHKTALGAEESVKWTHEKFISDALIKLKSNDFITVGVEQVEGGIQLNQFIPEKEKKYAFVFGHEIDGVSEEALKHCNLAIEIPQHGTKHSLNISVAAGVVCWEFIRHQL